MPSNRPQITACTLVFTTVTIRTSFFFLSSSKFIFSPSPISSLHSIFSLFFSLFLFHFFRFQQTFFLHFLLFISAFPPFIIPLLISICSSSSYSINVLFFFLHSICKEMIFSFSLNDCPVYILAGVYLFSIFS